MYICIYTSDNVYRGEETKFIYINIETEANRYKCICVFRYLILKKKKKQRRVPVFPFVADKVHKNIWRVPFYRYLDFSFLLLFWAAFWIWQRASKKKKKREDRRLLCVLVRIRRVPRWRCSTAPLYFLHLLYYPRCNASFLSLPLSLSLALSYVFFSFSFSASVLCECEKYIEKYKSALVTF